MPTQYDWSNGGEPQTEVEDDRILRSPFKKWWLRVILTILIIAVVAGTAYQIFQNKVNVVNQTARDEVLASHQVITDAATKADSDLIVGFLSGRDPAWANTVRAQTSEGELFEIPAISLVDIDNSPISTVEEISVSPNLDVAKVEARLVYPISADNADNGELSLIRTFIYRRGADRWLLSPPDKDDWGEQQTMASAMITVRYPARDELLVRRLIARLENTLTTICKRENGLSCPADYHFEIRLEPDLARLDGLNSEEANGISSDEITMPSFFLVGMPLDEAGYELLLRGYQSRVVSAVVADLVTWNCCENILFFEAFVDHLLADLAIQPWPLEAVDYEMALASMANLFDQDRLWQITDKNDSNDSQSDLVYAIVEFILVEKSFVQTLDIMRELVQEDNYQSWLSQVIDFRKNEVDVQGAWMNSLYEKSLSGQMVAASAIPEQDYYLVCQSSNPSTPKMYSYNFEANEFTLEDEADYFSYLTAFPDDDAIIYERLRGQERQTIVRQGETLDVVYRSDRGDGNGLQYTGILDDHGKQLLMYMVDADRQAIGRVRPVQYFRLGFENCQWPECNLQSLPGFTIWSPGYSNSIVQYPREQPGPYFELMRGDADGNPLAFLGPGRRPFWLNESTYGYINRSEEIVLAEISDDSIKTRITLQDLASVIESGTKRDLSVEYIEADRSGSGNLAIIATTRLDNPAINHLLNYNDYTEELSLVNRFEEVNVSSPRFSSGGTWLTIRTFEALGNNGSDPWSLYIYDLDQGEEKFVLKDSERQIGIEAHPPYDWSADGRWLVRAFRGSLFLTDTHVQIADGIPATRIIIPPLPNCDSVAWTNQN